MRNRGRNVHDIANSTQSWNLGVYAHNSTSGVYSANFAAGYSAGETTQMWLERCVSRGSTTDLETTTGATINTRRAMTSGVNIANGTIAGY